MIRHLLPAEQPGHEFCIRGLHVACTCLSISSVNASGLRALPPVLARICAPEEKNGRRVTFAVRVKHGSGVSVVRS